jgi:hypothetical protein
LEADFDEEYEKNIFSPILWVILAVFLVIFADFG